MRKIATFSMIAALGLFGMAGCNKGGTGSGSEAGSAAASSDAPPPPPGNIPDGQVAQYPTMTPASGTRVTNQGFTVYQAADRSSKQLGNISTGTWVNLKGVLAQWLLIEWPCGVGQLCPGWIEAGINDRRFTPDAGVGDAGGTTFPGFDAGVADAAAPVVPDAGKADAGAPAKDGGAATPGRPVIPGIPKPKKP